MASEEMQEKAANWIRELGKIKDMVEDACPARGNMWASSIGPDEVNKIHTACNHLSVLQGRIFVAYANEVADDE